MMTEKSGKIMPLLDPNHPFFRKPLVKWATVLLPMLWGGVEFLMGNTGWAVLFGAAGAYALWVLVIAPSKDR